MALVSKPNATIGIKRSAFNSGTKQSIFTAVSGLSAVPVFIDEIGTALREQGMAPEYDLTMLWDKKYDIRDGDQVTGYNPGGATIPPILTVQHAASDGIGTSLEVRVCMLHALKPAGSST